MSDSGITTLIHYPKPPHFQNTYVSLGYSKGAFQIAEKYSQEVISLPIYPGLTKKDAHHIINKVTQFFKEG